MTKYAKLFIIKSYDILDQGTYVGLEASPKKAEDLRLWASEQPEVAYACTHERLVLLSEVQTLEVADGADREKAGRVELREIPRKRTKKSVQKNANVSRSKGKG